MSIQAHSTKMSVITNCTILSTLLYKLPTLCKQGTVRMRCAIFPELAQKRLIRVLQTYLHCKALALNTSQGLINALFKSYAPMTN